MGQKRAPIGWTDVSAIGAKKDVRPAAAAIIEVSIRLYRDGKQNEGIEISGPQSSDLSRSKTGGGGLDSGREVHHEGSSGGRVGSH